MGSLKQIKAMRDEAQAQLSEIRKKVAKLNRIIRESEKKMKITLRIPEKIDGMNGKSGLFRGHWSKKTKKIQTYAWLFKAQTSVKFEGRAKVTVTRTYRGRKMDFDNLVSTSKLPFDALVLAGIIKDDSEDVIGQPRFFQKQIKGKEEHYYQIEIETF